MLNVYWHNHSLNLTEPAVDDFARAKKAVTVGLDWLARTGFRSCGASPPQVSSVPLGRRQNLIFKVWRTKKFL